MQQAVIEIHWWRPEWTAQVVGKALGSIPSSGNFVGGLCFQKAHWTYLKMELGEGVREEGGGVLESGCEPVVAEPGAAVVKMGGMAGLKTDFEDRTRAW